MKSWQWEKHITTKKHMKKMKHDEENEEGKNDWRRCGKCHAHRNLDMYVGGNETCNVCLERSRRWVSENSERMRETKERYRGSHREELREYNQEYSQREVDCIVCGCKVIKCKWKRHSESKRHMMGSDAFFSWAQGWYGQMWDKHISRSSETPSGGVTSGRVRSPPPRRAGPGWVRPARSPSSHSPASGPCA